MTKLLVESHRLMSVVEEGRLVKVNNALALGPEYLPLSTPTDNCGVVETIPLVEKGRKSRSKRNPEVTKSLLEASTYHILGLR